MKNNTTPSVAPKTATPSIFGLLKPYSGLVISLVALAISTNLLTLVVPKLISRSIDTYILGTFSLQSTIVVFSVVALAIFFLTYAQNVLQTYASEKVARDLRNTLSAKISNQSYASIQQITPSALLTNLTSDIDGIKLFVSQAIVSLISSALLVLGSGIILLSINWKLALPVLAIFPIIMITFFTVLAKVRVQFTRAQAVIDRLNSVISESILGSALIRVLNSQHPEYAKFLSANGEARDIGLTILRFFALLIPIISFVANLGMLIILTLGGKFVIDGNMTLGDFAAFSSYVTLMIFPIFVLGFMSNVIARATASYARINEVLLKKDEDEFGKDTSPLQGSVKIDAVQLSFEERPALRNISLELKPGTKTAIIGPTAAGKTQLLHLLTGLVRPDSGVILYDHKPLADFELTSLHEQIGFVFQDSVLFNLTIRENIAFNTSVTEENLQKAIDAAELREFVNALPDGLETIVSERGLSLSGGQKQRIMLARALSLNPKILLLDDFTARVDAQTEAAILSNVERLYPGITLLSVTQKISSVLLYDQIILLMEGEVVARGTHEDLLKTSPEYNQIYQTQRSTNTYEL